MRLNNTMIQALKTESACVFDRHDRKKIAIHWPHGHGRRRGSIAAAAGEIQMRTRPSWLVCRNNNNNSNHNNKIKKNHRSLLLTHYT